MTRDNGGPAFPVTEYSEEKSVGSTHGLSLRDYFAAKAMTGMMARDVYDAGQVTPELRARLAYIEADAMIAERSKP